VTAPGVSFTHGALFYDDLEGFLAGTVPFLEEGLGAGEPALVAVDRGKADALRTALPDTHGALHFADMTEVGRNPGRIISAWVDFVGGHAGAARLRGIGEPVWQGRSHDEIVECQRHEALLNVAFADQPGFELLCPYDSAQLDESVLAEARHSHPLLLQDGEVRSSTQYDEVAAPFAGSLSEPGAGAESLDLADHRLADVRRQVTELAGAAGIDPERVSDLALAVTEAATNTMCHAGGQGVLRMWRGAGTFVCEVQDQGWIRDPLAGRLPVAVEALTGRGLWLINQLCDLVQIRSSATGNVIRMHMNA
jgi:anti-sigma regulatory factor (Ser/Thr protein kinase)